jgi:serine/threonine-protein kinase RsbW
VTPETNAVFSTHCKWHAACISRSQIALTTEAIMSEEMTAKCPLDAEDLTQARVASPFSHSSHSAPFVGLRNTLPSDVDIISPFVEQLMRFISRFRAAGGNDIEIEVALREALVNAIVHGNKEDPNKLVYVKCRCTRDGEVSITVEDEGNGFEHEAVPDPTSLDNQLRTNGRGIHLIRTLMDEVDFEEGGSVLHMRKRANAGESELTIENSNYTLNPSHESEATSAHFANEARLTQ